MSENKQTKKECKDFMLKEYYLYINESRREYFYIYHIFSYFPYIYFFYNIGISFFFLTRLPSKYYESSDVLNF